jgi:competence protein ComEA
MLSFLKNYLTFNKRDRNGIILLLILLLLMLVFNTFQDVLMPSESIDFSEFNSAIETIAKAEKSANTRYENAPVPKHNTSYPQQNQSSSTALNEPFYFNPNNLSEEKWLALGLTEKQIKILKKYESKGGKFYKKEDLKKIYGISDWMYNRLEPYIQLATTKARDSSHFTSNFTKKDTVKKLSSPTVAAVFTQKIELNTADSSLLKKVKGIGSTFAKRILAYREKLGGFVSMKQLYEVWGLDSSTISTLQTQISLNPLIVRKIPLNYCTVSDLKKHPYFTYNLANNLVLYRDRHGEYQKLEDIKQAVLVNEELFRKIAPYLSLD